MFQPLWLPVSNVAAVAGHVQDSAASRVCGVVDLLLATLVVAILLRLITQCAPPCGR